ncbi:hypothetical protein 015DV004_70 [Bacillus phage 015DV004]|nr:hypothetical protein 015DV004_70 [Bacillus phage 015DV004]
MSDEYRKDKATFICSTPPHLTREAREKELKEFEEKFKKTIAGVQKAMERHKEINEDVEIYWSADLDKPKEREE